MITRSYGDIEFECDTCADTLETHTDDFNDAWAFAKDEGWIAHKDGDVWRHYCNRDCYNERND